MKSIPIIKEVTHCISTEWTSLKLASYLRRSLMVHLLVNACQVSFHPLHPANTHCTTLPPSMTAHAENRSTTLLGLQQKISCNLTTQVLDGLASRCRCDKDSVREKIKLQHTNHTQRKIRAGSI